MNKKLISLIAAAALGAALVPAAAQAGHKTVKVNSVTTAVIADGAVTTPKLAAAERSEAVVARNSTATSLNPLGAEISTSDSILQVTLPEGNWVVNAGATFGSNAAAERNIGCVLLDAADPIANGDTHTRALAIYSASMSLTGISDGGVVTLACATDPSGAQARYRSIVATRVATVTAQ